MSEQLARRIDSEQRAPTANEQIVGSLVAMGFSRQRASAAAITTGNVDLQAALDYMLQNPEPEPSVPAPVREPSTADGDVKDDATRGTEGGSTASAPTEQQQQFDDDHAIALELAAHEVNQLSLEEARQIRRGFSKLTVVKNGNMDSLLEQQRQALARERRAQEKRQDEEWAASGGSAASGADATGEFVTKHNSEINGERNAARLMALSWSDKFNAVGDLTNMRIPNKAFNGLRRDIQRLKTRSNRRIRGGRMTRASHAKALKHARGDASRMIEERARQGRVAMTAGSACMARRPDDRKWCRATIAGLATAKNRYMVRFETGEEAILKVDDIQLVEEDDSTETGSGEPAPAAGDAKVFAGEGASAGSDRPAVLCVDEDEDESGEGREEAGDPSGGENDIVHAADNSGAE